jgi:hypothetical protein
MDFWAVWDNYLVAHPDQAMRELSFAPLPGRPMGEVLETRISRQGVAGCLLWALDTHQLDAAEAAALALTAWRHLHSEKAHRHGKA